jgi:putative ABC transport system permease protein
VDRVGVEGRRRRRVAGCGAYVAGRITDAGAFGDGGGTDRLAGALVTASVGPTLGVSPILGRAFTLDDDRPGAPRVLLLAHRTWRSRYGGDAAVVGRTVTLDGRPATIVGVLPATAETLVPAADWWAPIALSPSERSNVGPRYLAIVGRLAERASLAAARDELTAIGARLGLTAADGSPLGVRVTPLLDHLTRQSRPVVLLLFAGVTLLVLIACANVASLLLTRAQDRHAELALRASLGASAARLARQLLVEAALLSAATTLGGLVVSLWLIEALQAVLPPDVPRLADARIDAVSAVFALAAGLIVTLVAGLAPALQGARVDLQSVLRAATASGAGRDGLRRGFVVAQVALAVVVASAGALVVQSAQALARAPRGYDARGVVSASLTLPATSYPDGVAIASVVDRIVIAARAVPGVTAAAAASQVPFAGGSAGSDVTLADQAFTDGVDRQARVRLVSPAYLSTLGVALVDGRELGFEDGAGARPVVVVNQTLARRLSPDGSPVGRDVKFDVPVFGGADGRRVWHVVGVAADTWDRGPREAVEPEVLIPIAQTPPDVFFWISRELQLAVRTGAASPPVASGIRQAVALVDPALPVGQVRSLDDDIAAAFARERLMARLLTGVAIAGVALALLGMVALVHQAVQRRRREIAVRLAIGATGHDVVVALVGEGARLAVAGVGAGAAASAASAGLLASLLYGVTPRDPATLAVVAIVVVALAALAAWLPARSAAAVDPAEALRS